MRNKLVGAIMTAAAIAFVTAPFIVLRLYWKSRKLPAYRHRIGERFSINNASDTIDVWIHGVSLGEIIAATPLINACLAKEWRVLVTTMTPTGSQQVVKQFSDRVRHQYLPYDFPGAWKRFFKAYQPRLGIIMETELWPNMIVQSRHKGVPLLLMNARLSDGAFKQYEKLDFFFKPILNQFTAILAQSMHDAQQFLALGADPSIVEVSGNMKFDVPLQQVDNKELLSFKDKWGSSRPVVIAASTHNDEEQQLLTRLTQLKEGIPGVVLLFAPRHPERFQEVYRLSCAQNWHTGLRSQPESIKPGIDVVVLDSMGELLPFYQTSDYAFVGGSLVPIGGHNVLEPIAVNVPVFCGPFMMNSKEVCRDLKAATAMIQVNNADELIKALIEMHRHPNQRQQQIINASEVMAANRGAVARCMAKIEPFLVK